MHRNFRKPLIIAAPKIGLKHPKAISALEDFAQGSSFQPIIVKNFGNEQQIRKVVLCSGKIGFDIDANLDKAQFEGGVKVIKVEEIAPFPVKLVQEQLSQVGKDVDVCWIQEESCNEGAFQFAKLHLDRLLEDMGFSKQKMGYVGRDSCHSFCTGAGSINKMEVQKLWEDFEKAI